METRLANNLCERLSSIQHRLETVAVSIHSFAQLANSLPSQYSRLIDYFLSSRDYSLPILFEAKLTELRRQQAHLRRRRARLKVKYGDLSQQLQTLEARELAAHEGLCDPLDDCTLEERAVEKLELELDRLRLKLSDVQYVKPLKKVNFRLRRAEIRARLAEIQIAKQELAGKSYSIPSNPAPEISYPDLEDFYEKCDERQKAIDKLNRELDDLCALNQRQRRAIEAEYNIRLKRVALLTDEIEDGDRTRLQIHEVSGAIALDQERQQQLSDQRRNQERGVELSKSQAMAVEKLAANNQEAKGRVRRRKANLRDQEQALVHRREVLDREKANAELLVQQHSLMGQRVLDLERKVAESEKQCDAFNENLKVEAQAVDRVLFQASSIRADSRVKRLNELLESRTGSTFTGIRTMPRTEEVTGAIRSRVSFKKPL
jgi:hypothetical protein